MGFFILVQYCVQGQSYWAKDSCIGSRQRQDPIQLSEAQYDLSEDTIKDQYENTHSMIPLLTRYVKHFAGFTNVHRIYYDMLLFCFVG